MLRKGVVESSVAFCTTMHIAAEYHCITQEAEDAITDLQKELFKAQGIDGGWGIQCLGQVGDTYQDDTEFMKLFVTAVERYICFKIVAARFHACLSRKIPQAAAQIHQSLSGCCLTAP